MATLPQSIDRAVASRFETESKSFSEKAAQLSKLAPTLTNANLALEYDTEAKNWLANAEAERVKMKKPILDAGRAVDDFWSKMMAPIRQVRYHAGTVRANYERERQRKIADQKRLDEQRQLAASEAARKAEADHYLDIAAKTGDESALAAAIEVENTPLAPVVSTVDPDAGKVPGSSVTIRKTGKIVDIRAFSAWLSTYASATDLIQVKSDPADTGPAFWITQSAIDDKLNRGIEIPGVEVLERAITRNTSR